MIPPSGRAEVESLVRRSPTVTWATSNFHGQIDYRESRAARGAVVNLKERRVTSKSGDARQARRVASGRASAVSCAPHAMYLHPRGRARVSSRPALIHSPHSQPAFTVRIHSPHSQPGSLRPAHAQLECGARAGQPTA